MIRARRARLLGAGLLMLVALLISLHWLSRPDRVANFVTRSLGDALGLEISASGTAEYRLRGTPSLVLRNVVARQPGAAAPMLRAQRVFVSVPWSTVRSRGARLDITRIEIDAPRIDVAALQHWLAARPARESRMPTLRDGIALSGGRVDGSGWRLEGLSIALPRLLPDVRVEATVVGRFVTDAMTMAFHLSAAMTRPSNDAGIALIGPVTATMHDQRFSGRLQAAGPLHIGDDDIRIARLRASLSGLYESGTTPLPATLAIASPLRYASGTISLSPAGIALRGSDRSSDPVPDVDARGAIAVGKRLAIRLDGLLATWPDAWPTLPPPIGASTAPLPFALRYAGAADFSDDAILQLQRDATRFDGRFRIADVAAWATATTTTSPLPPMTGRIVLPRVDISGAQLEGVEIDLREDVLDADSPSP